MADWEIDGINLNDKSITFLQSGNYASRTPIDPWDILTQDSDETIVSRMGGVVRKITLQIILKGTPTNVKSKYDSIRASLVFDNPEKTSVFTSPLTGTIDVMVEQCRMDFQAIDINTNEIKADMTIDMIEGKNMS